MKLIKTIRMYAPIRSLRAPASALGCLSLFVLSGCFTAPPRAGGDLQRLPGAYSTSGAALAVEPDAAWWDSFERSDLNALEAQAFEGNLDIAQAWARLRQSEAAARQAGAGLYPSVDLSSGYDRTWRSQGDQRDTAANHYEVGVAISYDVDLWGKIRSTRNAAEARALATADDLQSTALSISENVANRWIEILEAENRVALLQEQLRINSTQLELIELRFRNSRANSLDVYQQRQTVARTRSSIPRAEAERLASLYALNLLLGQAATESQVIDWKKVFHVSIKSIYSLVAKKNMNKNLSIKNHR